MDTSSITNKLERFLLFQATFIALRCLLWSCECMWHRYVLTAVYMHQLKLHMAIPTQGIDGRFTVATASSTDMGSILS